MLSDETNKTNIIIITITEHVNNYNVNIFSHEKCLPVSICQIIMHKITKTTPHAYCNSQ